MILNPNCSEQVFKLHGSLDEIKQEIHVMIDIISADHTRYLAEQKQPRKEDIEYDNKIQQACKNKKKELEACKSLEEIEDIVIPFTTNYETFFKVNPNEDDCLVVATCNNIDWGDVTKQDTPDTDEWSYYKWAGKEYMDMAGFGKDWFALKRTEGRWKNKVYMMEYTDGGEFKEEYKGMPHIEVVAKKEKWYRIESIGLREIQRVKDPIKLKRIREELVIEAI